MYNVVIKMFSWNYWQECLCVGGSEPYIFADLCFFDGENNDNKTGNEFTSIEI